MSSSPSQSARSQERCRIVLVVDAGRHIADVPENAHGGLEAAFQNGDIASVIFRSGSLDEEAFQDHIEPLVSLAQKTDIAAIVCDYSSVAGRVGADGLQLGQDPNILRDTIAKFAPGMMIGAGNVKTRHNALVIGELEPDYLMFGKPGGDTRPQANPKNLELGEWWSSMVEIPAIVLGGSNIESVVEVAATGAEFVALSDAIFAPQGKIIDSEGIATQVAAANQLLDKHAPSFPSFNED